MLHSAIYFCRPEVVVCVEGVVVRLLGVDCGATKDKVSPTVLLMVGLVAEIARRNYQKCF